MLSGVGTPVLVKDPNDERAPTLDAAVVAGLPHPFSVLGLPESR